MLTRRDVLRLPLAIGTVAAVGTITALEGCAPPWTIIRQATPNPLVGTRAFAILPISFEGVIIGGRSEEAYLSRRSDNQRASYEADKQAMVTRLFERLAGNSAGLVLRPLDTAVMATVPVLVVRFVYIELGTNGGFGFGGAAASGRNSQTSLMLRIVSPDGTPIDEVELHATRPSGSFSSSGARMRRLGDSAADVIFRYLRERTQPPAAT